MLILTALSMLAVFPVIAMGDNEQGQPEPIDTKTVSEANPVSKDDPDYPPEGWVTDITEAYRIAGRDNKEILVDFTGSDWCVWCQKLSKEVFTTDEFKRYADENLVLLFLDFPQSITLPAEQIRHNQIISQLLGVRGYPSIWLLKSDLSPIMATGYQAGGAEKYIEHLENYRPEIDVEESENFRMAFTKAIEDNIGPLE